MARTKRAGRGKGIEFLRALVGHEGDECVIWPFYRLPHTGYGFVGIEREMHYANRIMCELAKGPPPTPEHESAHSCNKGHDGCVNPKHLSWKTHSENQLDRRGNGTSTNRAKHRKLTFEQVNEIRSLKGIETQAVLAVRFGVSRENICIIQSGRTWQPDKLPRQFSHEEIRTIRASKKSDQKLAVEYGAGRGTIWRIRTWKSYKYVQASD